VKIKRSKKYPKLRKGESAAIIRLNAHQNLVVVFGPESRRPPANKDEGGKS